MRELDPHLVTLTQEGAEAYAREYELVLRREAEAPNQVWQADHAELKVWVLDDEDVPRKPWITIVEDDHSRAIAGYHLDFEKPSILRTSLAFRHAIWHKADPRWRVCGIPETFYTDNGPDFASNHIEHVAAELNVELVFCTPGRPEGKGKVERFARTIGDMFVEGLPGWAPKESKTVKEPPKGEQLLRLGELAERFEEFAMGDYNRRVHGATRQEPRERWIGEGWMPRLPLSEDELDLLLIHVAKPRKVWKDGIRFERETYSSLALAPYVGRRVEVRYDPRDVSEIRVYHEDDLVCRATCNRLAGQRSMPLKELQRTRRRRKAELREQARERMEAVNKLVPLGRTKRPKSAASEKGKPAPARGEAGPRLKKYRSE